MRVETETGVQVESAIETGWECTTCHQYSRDEYDPCANCVGAPIRREALRWALETTIDLGADEARLLVARQRPAEKTMGVESEWRWEALRALANRDDLADVIHWIGNDMGGLGFELTSHDIDPKKYPDTMDHSKFVGLVLSQRSGTKDGKTYEQLVLPLYAGPTFISLLLNILTGADDAAHGLRAAFARIGMNAAVMVHASTTGHPPWFLAVAGNLMNPAQVVQFMVSIASACAAPETPCSGCKLPLGHQQILGEWCTSCLPVLWAGELMAHAPTPRKAIEMVVERRAKPSTTLPEFHPVAIVNVIDRMTFDDEYLRVRLCHALATREWCGVRWRGEVEEMDELVMSNGPTFALRVMLDLERHEQPGIIGLTKEQARRLLPMVIAIPWYMPNARERVERAIEEVIRQ